VGWWEDALMARWDWAEHHLGHPCGAGGVLPEASPSQATQCYASCPWVFWATFKLETTLPCWGKLQWVMLLPLWQDDSRDKGRELFTQAHAEVWKAHSDTKSN